MVEGSGVEIVGTGIVCPAGSSSEAAWTGVHAGRSHARALDFDVDGLGLIGHTVEGDEWTAPFTRSERRRIDRFALLGMAAMEEAVLGLGGAWDDLDPARRAMVAGVGFGGIGTLTRQHRVLLAEGWRKMSPFGVASVMASSLVAYGSIRFAIRGSAATVSSACASGAQALADGARLIAAGDADLVVAGGAEAPLDVLPMASFARMEAMVRTVEDPTTASRPFDRDRHGFVLGEGAAFAVLASSETRRDLGLRSHGTVDGWAVTTDGHHITAPDPEGRGAQRCIADALDRAGLGPADISHVNAHGTGTQLNDLTEARVLAEVFGAGGVPVTSLKGSIGHLMGAAGAVEAIVAARSATEGLVPPTVNCDHIDDAIDLDVVVDGSRRVPPGPALSCSFGFGGQNAALVLGPAPNQADGR